MAIRSVIYVLTPERWAELLPLEDYIECRRNPNSESEKAQQVKQHALKYLIALGQPDYNILPHIQQLKEANSPKLNSNFGKHALTALHIATMRDRFEVVEALIEAGANVNIPDAHGWTTLHHAALVSDRIFELFISKGANRNAKTLVGGTYQDLKRLFGLERAQLRNRILYQRLHQTSIEEINTEELEQLTKLQCYSDEYRWPNDMAELLWDMPPEEYSPSYLFESQSWHNGVLLPAYQKYRETPPRLIVKEVEFRNSAQLQKRAVGLVAAENLKGGSVVAEYTGKMTVLEEKKASSLEEYIERSLQYEYLLGNIDASECGNLARFINDGWPNVFSQFVINEHGKDVRTVFIAVEPEGIKQGADILWDYGCGQLNLKWGYYLMSNKEQIRRFFREKSLEDYQKMIGFFSEKAKGTYLRQRGKIELESFLLWLQIEQKLLYPLNTPAVLIDLTCSRIIPPKKWTILLKDPVLRQRLDYAPHCCYLDYLLQILDEFHNLISSLEAVERTKPLADKICTLLLQKEDVLSVLQMAKGLVSINKQLKNFISSHPVGLTSCTESKILEITRALEETISSLRSYNWEQDNEFVFPKSWKHLLRGTYQFKFISS